MSIRPRKRKWLARAGPAGVPAVSLAAPRDDGVQGRTSRGSRCRTSSRGRWRRLLLLPPTHTLHHAQNIPQDRRSQRPSVQAVIIEFEFDNLIIIIERKTETGVIVVGVIIEFDFDVWGKTAAREEAAGAGIIAQVRASLDERAADEAAAREAEQARWHGLREDVAS
ncbi:hypothetical protein DFH27DRAFT_528688 [Peziza echinospora]|nr:hypothetical protein DFH27DRAFT_530001 [Peziza echinospora]KAI5783872.1 hypothetical protein DFH27DRAFT_528688 [Peziza echinospora]